MDFQLGLISVGSGRCSHNFGLEMIGIVKGTYKIQTDAVLENNDFVLDLQFRLGV